MSTPVFGENSQQGASDPAGSAMDLSTLVQTALIATLVGSAASLLPALAYALLSCLTTVVHVDGRRRIAVLDEAVGRRGLCSCRRIGPGSPPADGVHAVFLSGPVFAVRTTSADGHRGGTETIYILYVFGAKARRRLEELTSGDPSEVTVRWIEVPAAWRTEVTTARQRAPRSARQWQSDVIRQISEAYTRDGQTSALINGPPGLGKTRLAELLAVELRSRLAVEPIVVKGFDPTARGLMLDDVLGCPTPTAPVILVMDEFDTVVAHAEKQLDGSGEGSSIAKNRTSMLGCLDRLGLTQNVIVIATTNKDVALLDDAYTREGRLNLRFSLGPANAKSLA